MTDTTTKLTADERRDVATDLLRQIAYVFVPAGVTADDDSDVADACVTGAVAAFRDVPNGTAHLNAAFGTIVGELVASDPVGSGATIAALNTFRGAIESALSTPAVRPTRVIDTRGDDVAAYMRLAHVHTALTSLTADVESAIAAMSADVPTAEEIAAWSPDDRLTKRVAALIDATNGAMRGKSRRAGSGTTRVVVGGHAPLVGGTYGRTVRDVLQPYTLTVSGDAFTVTGDDGSIIGTATSATAAAKLVNGGGSVNGRDFWNVAIAADGSVVARAT